MKTLIDIQEDPQASPLRKLRVLLVMKFTIKALSTKVLMLSRCHFQKATPEILQCITGIWGSTNGQVLQLLSHNGGSALPSGEFLATLEACKLTLQCIKSLLVYGLQQVNQSPAALEILGAVLHSLREFIMHTKAGTMRTPVEAYVHKYIIVMCKTIVALHKARPGPFEPFLVPFLELLWGELSSLSSDLAHNVPVLRRECSNFLWYCAHSPIGLSIFCMRYIKSVISVHHSPTPKKPRGRAPELIRSEEVVRNLLTAARITQLSELIISKFFCLGKEDFEAWQNEPEELVNEIASDDTVYELHPASQSLFSVCISHFDEAISAHTIQLLQSVAYRMLFETHPEL
jgi:hypothetical protein